MVAINQNQTIQLSNLVDLIMGLERKDYLYPTSQVRVIQPDWADRKLTLQTKDGDFPMSGFCAEQFDERWKGLKTFHRGLDERELSDVYLPLINDLLYRDTRNVMVRTIQPNGTRTARAVVSDAFKRIDDDLLVPNVLEEVGKDAGNWRSLGGNVTYTNTYIKFISRAPQITLEVDGRTRPLHIGFQYENSEVGRGHAKFSAFLFDRYCENGCVFGSITVADVCYMHRGSRITSDAGLIFDNRIERLALAEIQGAVTEATRLTLEGRHVAGVRNLLEASLNKRIPKGRESEFIEAVGRELGLSETDVEGTKVRLGGSTNAFGLQAAITALAKDVESYDKRQRLEEIGGEVLTMGDRKWNSLIASLD